MHIVVKSVDAQLRGTERHGDFGGGPEKARSAASRAMATTTQTLQQHMIVPSHSSVSSHVEHAVTLHTMRMIQEAFDGKHGLAGVLRLAMVVGFDTIKALPCEAIGKAFSSATLAKLWAWLGPLLDGLRRSVLAGLRIPPRQQPLRDAAAAAAAAAAAGRTSSTALDARDAALHKVSFSPHAAFWRALLLPPAQPTSPPSATGPADGCADGRGWSVSRRVAHGSRALVQRDLGALVASEVWTDIVVEDRRPGGTGVRALIDTPVTITLTYDAKVQLRHDRALADAAASAAASSGGEWVPDPDVCDVTHAAADRDALDCKPAKGSFRTYLDLVPFPEFRKHLRTIITAEYGCVCKGPFTTPSTVMFYPPYVGGSAPSCAASISNKFATKAFFTLCEALPLADKDDTELAFNEFCVLMASLFTADTALSAAVQLAHTGKSRLFGVELDEVTMSHLNFQCSIGSTHTARYLPEVNEVREWLMRQLFPTAANSNSNSNSNSSSNGGLDVFVRDAAQWREFVRGLCAPSNASTASDAPVAVHLVQMADVTSEAAKPNPAFAAWERRQWRSERDGRKGRHGQAGGVGDADGDGDGDRDRDGDRDGDESSPPPPETLSVTTARRELRVERVSTVRKPMDTVYLRRDDRDTLMRSLELFRDRKDLVAELGLPHKLGVLLHGPPGTGKSTTIAAIATFLQKDLHYVSLGTVRTNAELRLLFDHVTSNCARGGGIVVMEDVDAMAPVVLDRRRRAQQEGEGTGNGEGNGAGNSKGAGTGAGKGKGAEGGGGDELTLDFMLNLLQGTMTIDGMVFVATTNHLDMLDPAFYREGRFDVLLQLGECDREQVRAAFARFFGRDPRSDALASVAEGVHTPAAVVARLARFLCVQEDDAVVLGGLRPP